MAKLVSQAATPPRRRGFPVHWAWIVAGASLVVLIGSSGFRALPSVVMMPMHREFGWSHGTISLAIGVNLVVFGITAPFAAALMERFSIRYVVTGALVLMAIGSGAPVLSASPLALVIYWGFLVGIGGGAIALAYVATLTNRWFAKHRGLVIGVLTAGGTAGQLVFLPLLAWSSDQFGWRAASWLVAGAALIAAPFAYWLVRDRPADLGLRAYGASDGVADEDAGLDAVPPTSALRELRLAARTRVFWWLALSFAICGVTTAGLVQTHFIPAAMDHGMPQTTAAGLLALAGVMDIIGTTASGWLTDRVDSRVLLAVYYGLRGLSLLLLPVVFAASPTPSMLGFIVFYGLDWIATVPPTIRLCQEHFGAAAGIVFGWMWTAHQFGGAIAAVAAGYLRDYLGGYTGVWYGAGVICLLTVVLVLTIPHRPAARRSEPKAEEPRLSQL